MYACTTVYIWVNYGPKANVVKNPSKMFLVQKLWNINNYTYILSYKTHPETERNPNEMFGNGNDRWLLRMGLHVLYLGDWSVELSFWKDLYRAHHFNKPIRKTWRYFFFFNHQGISKRYEDIQCQLDANEEPCQLFGHDELLYYRHHPSSGIRLKKMPRPASRKAVLNTRNRIFPYSLQV